MKKVKLILAVMSVILLVSSLSSVMLFADNPLTFTLSNSTGKNAVSSDSFNEARITYYSKYHESTFAIAYINKDAEIKASEIFDYGNTISFSSPDNSVNKLAITSNKVIHNSIAFFKFTNLNLQIDEGVTFKKIFLLNCVLDNINAASEISIKTDSTIIINENTVYNNEITVSNGASLTFEIAENATLSAQNITIKSGSVRVVGGCLKDNAVPLISSISEIVLPEGFSYTKSYGNFIIAKNSAPVDSQAEPEDSSATDDSQAEPEDSSATDDSKAESENSSAPDDSKAEPNDGSTPDDSQGEPKDGSTPDDSQGEPVDNSAPDDSKAEPEDSSAPDDSQGEPKDGSTPDDSQNKPKDSSAFDNSKSPSGTSSSIIKSDSDKDIDNNHSALEENLANENIPLVAENPETGAVSYIPIFIAGIFCLLFFRKKSLIERD